MYQMNCGEEKAKGKRKGRERDREEEGKGISYRSDRKGMGE
jgi:hypothetical protein